MNCPSRTDPVHTDGWNQSPNALNADATTGADLTRLANARLQRDHRIDPANCFGAQIELIDHHIAERADTTINSKASDRQGHTEGGEDKGADADAVAASPPDGSGSSDGRIINKRRKTIREFIRRAFTVLLKYARFIGPGFMVSVAYIDPGTHISLHFLLNPCPPSKH